MPVLVVGTTVTHGIISDIDDTVLSTSLPRPMIAAWNTFMRSEGARRPVPGMATMYRELLAAHPDAPVIYLSTGAWNTAPLLTRFLRRSGFPAGPDAPHRLGADQHRLVPVGPGAQARPAAPARPRAAARQVAARRGRRPARPEDLHRVRRPGARTGCAASRSASSRPASRCSRTSCRWPTTTSSRRPPRTSRCRSCARPTGTASPVRCAPSGRGTCPPARWRPTRTAAVHPIEEPPAYLLPDPDER